VLGWTFQHEWTLLAVVSAFTVTVLALRIAYHVADLWATLRLKRRGADAAESLAGWLHAQPGGTGGRHSAVYTWYMQSPQWQARRERTLLLAGHACQRCGQRATDVHHKHYQTLGFERDGDLEALCEDCHRAAHGRRWGRWGRRVSA
jgi:hypothetical protein